MIRTSTVGTLSPKRVALIFGGVVVAIAAMFVLIGHLTQGPEATWRQAAPSFRQVVTAPQWQAFVQRHDLASIRTATWRRRSVHDQSAIVSGWITSDRGLASAAMLLEQDGATWRMSALSIQGDRLGRLRRWYR